MANVVDALIDKWLGRFVDPADLVQMKTELTNAIATGRAPNFATIPSVRLPKGFSPTNIGINVLFDKKWFIGMFAAIELTVLFLEWMTSWYLFKNIRQLWNYSKMITVILVMLFLLAFISQIYI